MKKPFAVFDIDGTLIRWQLYHAVVDRLAKKGHLGLDAHEEIHRERMVWKRRTHTDSFDDYQQFLVKMYEKALGKLRPSVFDQIAGEVANEYADQVYIYTRDLIKELKSKDYILLAISGSHHELIGMISKKYGFTDWIGSHYHRAEGKFTGQSIIASHDKKSALEKLIKKHDLGLQGSIAIGDTQSDIEIMQMVENPIAFNPNRRLFDQARASKWPIVVERKNVIYKLEPKDGSYVLA